MASSSTTPASSSQSTASVVEHNRRAIIWEHFEMVLVGTERKARCKMCSKLLSISGNSTLVRHQKSCESKQAPPESSQAQISGAGQIWTYDQMRQRELQAKFVIKRGLPFSVFDNDDGTEYIHGGLQPKYQKVSRITLRRDTIRLYLEAKQELITYFENFEGRVSLTSDVWTSNLNLGLAYLCITCHWIDPISWEQNKRVICFTGFEFPHTAVALYKVIMKCAREFKINDKILSISLDNASNNTAAIELLKRDLKPFLNGAFFHTRCVCHVLNLVVQDSLKAVSVYINKIRDMLRTIYCTKQRAQDFRKFCKSQNQKYLKPQLDMPVRWNSTYKMLKRALLQKDILMEYYSLLNIENGLCETDWNIIEHYVDLLKCFYRATVSLSGVYYPTSALVIEHLVHITEKFSYYRQHEGWAPLIKIMEEIFLKYYREIPPMFSCAAALNPLLNVEGVENLIDAINTNLTLNINYDDDDPVSTTSFTNFFTQSYNYYNNLYGSRPREEITLPKTKDSFKNKILDLASRKKARTSGSLDELGLYTKTQFSDFMSSDEIENFDLLNWWKGKANTYPVLACMARDLLTVQASTVASESAFSLSGRVLNERRSRLNEDSLEICICYKDYLDSLKRRQHITALEDSSEEIEDEMDALNLNLQDD